MEHIDYEEQEQIYSDAYQKSKEVQQYKEYLVNSGTIQHFVKFLFGLRTKQLHDQGVPNSDALEMFKQYFGSLTPDTTEQDSIKKQINEAKMQNEKLNSQLLGVKEQIDALKQKIQKKREEKRLKQEQQAKNPKKGKK